LLLKTLTQFHIIIFPGGFMKKMLILTIVSIFIIGGVGRGETTSFLGVEWIKIPEGEFQMGSTRAKPVHTVFLDTYYLSKNEVTFAQYDAFCEATGRKKPDDNGWGRGSRPVMRVSHNDANAFCKWFSEKTGKKIMLPTEAQWEKACRAGSSDEQYGKLDAIAWHYRNSGKKTHPVGQKQANGYGLYDMLGNVSEWCSDWYSRSYRPTLSRNPRGPDHIEGSIRHLQRVVRGGSWDDTAYYARASSRRHFIPGGFSNSIGFRLAYNAEKSFTVTVPSVPSIEWIDIPAGNFQMGDNFKEGFKDERPVHTVHLSAYKISKYEVTFEQYEVFCDDTKKERPSNSGFGRGSQPVINVSWNDAKAFCDWLSQKTGANIHLPTEAQWEKAARGTDQRRYPWGDSSPDCGKAEYLGCRGRPIKPVGSHPSGVSPYGVHDMAGNVMEWCSDWYSKKYYSKSPGSNPTGPSSGSVVRVTRGGHFSSLQHDIRSARRTFHVPSYTNIFIGFRVAQD
jgi:formylglycine-generating enzyme required for sulfatase activity